MSVQNQPEGQQPYGYASSEAYPPPPQQMPPPPVGAQPYYPVDPAYPAGGQTVPTKATVSVVLGVIGLIVFPVICSVLAVIIGYQARSAIDKSVVLGGRSRATTGIVLGWVGLAGWILIVLVALSSS